MCNFAEEVYHFCDECSKNLDNLCDECINAFNSFHNNTFTGVVFALGMLCGLFLFMIVYFFVIDEGEIFKIFKKKKAKKPKYVSSVSRKIDIARCPGCYAYLQDFQVYCDNCGCEIDWNFENKKES